MCSMPKDITPEFAKTKREEAQWAYEKEMEKFYYRLIEITFLKIKTLLNEKGLKKIAAIDEKRDSNENYGIEFSQKTWTAISKTWNSSQTEMMKSILNLYGLKNLDLDFPHELKPTEEDDDDFNLDLFA